MIKDFNLLAKLFCLKVMFDNVYGEICFIGLLATNLCLKVMFDNLYREIAFACILLGISKIIFPERALGGRRGPCDS